MNILQKMFQPRVAGVRNADVQEVAPRAASMRIVDVREPDEFVGDLGHIANAELVPLATLPDAARDWPRDAELLVVCRSGARSSRAAQTLKDSGFQNVVNLTGGMTAWNAASLPIERQR